MTYFNNLGQGRIGWRSPGGGVTPSTLWTSVYAVYNADAVGSSSLNTSLFAAYNGESNANDSFGTNNGTPKGGLTYTAGKIGDAFQFNGTTAYVELPNNSNQFNFTGDFTVSTWINTPNYTSNRMIFVNYVPGGTYGYGIFIYHASNNVFSFELRNGNTIGQYQTSAGITTNSWNHITFVRKVGQAAKIYLNGVLISGAYSLGNSSIAPSFPGTQIVNIGSNTLGGSLANYKQDATTIWNKELTQSEITELYNSGNGTQYITDSFYKPTTNDALNTYNGTAQGGLTYGVGKVGTAFQFNGTNAIITTDNNMAFMFNNAFTFSFWIKPTNFSVNSPIIHNFPNAGGEGQKGFQLVLETNARLRFRYIRPGNLSGNFSSDSAILSNQWSHVVFSFNLVTGAYQFYTNGTLVKSSNYLVGTSILYPTNTTLNYGQIGSTSYNGSIDAFNVWNRVLTSTEVTELYNSGNGKQYPN